MKVELAGRDDQVGVRSGFPALYLVGRRQRVPPAPLGLGPASAAAHMLKTPPGALSACHTAPSSHRGPLVVPIRTDVRAEGPLSPAAGSAPPRAASRPRLGRRRPRGVAPGSSRSSSAS